MRRIKRTDGSQATVEDSYVLKNGEAYVVSLDMMDSRRGFVDSTGAPCGGKPGFVFRDGDDQTALDRAHQEYRDGIEQRWRSDRWQTKPKPVIDRPRQEAVAHADQAAVDASYAQYSLDISNRWKQQR